MTFHVSIRTALCAPATTSVRDAPDPASVICRSGLTRRALQGLLEASCKFPAWLGDPDADQFKPYRKIFATEIKSLQKGLATDVVREQTDPETAEQLFLSLWPILRIPQRYYDLFRTVQIWDECKLQLPESYAEGSICVTETTSDSMVLFWPAPDFGQKFFYRPHKAPALSCLAREHTPAVLHWTTEYTQDDALAASRQTRMAMVSGLYQRRALGFIDHFVFGTAHSGNRLEVFAGRWESVGSPADQETGDAPTQATPDQTDQDTTPPEAVGSTSNLPKMDKYEIKIYQFPGYFLSSPLDMVEFYMLMRASYDLASYLWKIVLGRQTPQVPNKKGRGLIPERILST
ncbi:hypothetical protein CTheo_6989 [Ceratobasidium theobromae]|uniref:Uncharacterized protein n=1 Tax=Ceratobasidium theobromae TaxID=1582974 RepID=A0A5N5QDF3_9AGAM|nr:hypothetical protein CTheo_6989 [Ceratobasidium theobromae]